MKGDVAIISFLACFLFVFRNATDFCELTLLKVLLISGSFLVEFLGCLLYHLQIEII